MERIVVYIFSIFLIAFLLMMTPAPASYPPQHTSKIQIEVESDKLQQALQLLDQHPEYKQYVEKRISTIRTGKLSRIHAKNNPAVFDISDTFIEEHSIEYLASTLVHEARHVDQYHPYKILSDQNAELDAMSLQASALKVMGGTEKEYTDLIYADGLHFDTNGNGILDPQDNWGY